ncbi:MAG TPA: chitobiase/beta-hexosaminidase C-terminal domain-containing protein, partial [Planctomycetaceae bacterium]|nr:chitobiase/beta-hexosaminidase C-terminal domain-containing protein [Planctomycetaceae bacterium]
RRFKYLRNLMPDRTYAQPIDYMDQMPTMREMRRLAADGQLEGAEALYFRATKPIEELYDLQSDPHEVENVADRPEFQEDLMRLRQVLEDWQVSVGDLGLIPEPLLMEDMRPNFEMETAERPEITTAARPGTSDLRVTITCPTRGASIAWTTDKGERPQWKLYAGPFDVPAGSTVRAVACRLGFMNSTVTQAIP